MSSLQLLLTRWGVRMLKEPQFFEFIKYLITTELLHHKEGFKEAWRILTHFSQDFSVGNSSRPLLYPENPNNTDHIPEWWSLVECLLDQLETMYPKNYEWLFLLKLRDKTQRLVEADSSRQDARDSVLYDMFMYYFRQPGTYGMFARLLVDRLIGRGANINAHAGMCDETILYLFCYKVNRAIYDEESGPYRTPRRKHFIYDLCLPWMKDSIKAFALALLDKGANPLIEVRGSTALEVLKSGYSDMVKWKQLYLDEVEAAILHGRSEFLEYGPTPNLKAWRPHLRNYRWEEHVEANSVPTHRERPEKLVWPYGGGPGPVLSAGYFRADDYDTIMYLRRCPVHG